MQDSPAEKNRQRWELLARNRRMLREAERVEDKAREALERSCRRLWHAQAALLTSRESREAS